jgi:dTDP-4-dehydrorhamnose 3,5-epimerase-like enzyme
MDRATGPIDVCPIDIEKVGRSRPAAVPWVFYAEVRGLGLPPFTPVQWNISSRPKSCAGSTRALNKLVHVASGTVFAAIADLRAVSPTAGGHLTGELTAPRSVRRGRARQRLRQPGRSGLGAYLVDRHWSPDETYPVGRLGRP